MTSLLIKNILVFLSLKYLISNIKEQSRKITFLTSLYLLILVNFFGFFVFLVFYLSFCSSIHHYLLYVFILHRHFSSLFISSLLYQHMICLLKRRRIPDTLWWTLCCAVILLFVYILSKENNIESRPALSKVLLFFSIGLVLIDLSCQVQLRILRGLTSVKLFDFGKGGSVNE